MEVINFNSKESWFQRLLPLYILYTLDHKKFYI